MVRPVYGNVLFKVDQNLQKYGKILVRLDKHMYEKLYIIYRAKQYQIRLIHELNQKVCSWEKVILT